MGEAAKAAEITRKQRSSAYAAGPDRFASMPLAHAKKIASKEGLEAAIFLRCLPSFASKAIERARLASEDGVE